MELASLEKTTKKSKKRVGRGYGSGRGGHTSGRGAKGQKARSSVGLFFEGTKFKKSLIKRLPLFRGKGKLKPTKARAYVVNLKYLAVFKANEEVTLETLKEKRIIAKDFSADNQIKILGEGELGVPLTVKLPTSKPAQEKIEKAGGKIVIGEAPKTEEKKPEKKTTKKTSTKVKK